VSVHSRRGSLGGAVQSVRTRGKCPAHTPSSSWAAPCRRRTWRDLCTDERGRGESSGNARGGARVQPRAARTPCRTGLWEKDPLQWGALTPHPHARACAVLCCGRTWHSHHQHDSRARHLVVSVVKRAVSAQLKPLPPKGRPTSKLPHPRHALSLARLDRPPLRFIACRGRGRRESAAAAVGRAVTSHQYAFEVNARGHLPSTPCRLCARHHSEEVESARCVERAEVSPKATEGSSGACAQTSVDAGRRGSVLVRV